MDCVTGPVQTRAMSQRAQDQYGVKIQCCEETEPLGTAGPIALAKSEG